MSVIIQEPIEAIEPLTGDANAAPVSVAPDVMYKKHNTYHANFMMENNLSQTSWEDIPKHDGYFLLHRYYLKTRMVGKTPHPRYTIVKFAIDKWNGIDNIYPFINCGRHLQRKATLRINRRSRKASEGNLDEFYLIPKNLNHLLNIHE